MQKFVEFTIGAATSNIKALLPASSDWFITMPSTTTIVMTHMGGVPTADVVTITLTTADANYASHAAVVDAFAKANEARSNPDAVVIPALPIVGVTQQLITSVAID